jgi:hypothetical protein
MTSWSNHTDVPWHSYRNNIKSVAISNGVTSIGKYAFYYNENLESVTIPDGLTSIGSAAFSNCYKLANMTLPNSVTYINDYVFSDCNSLVSVTIGNGVKSIGYAAFEGCNSLLRIIIPDGVSYIGQYAFSFCESLNSVTIPDSVTQIGYSAFGGCHDIADVYYMGSEGQWSGIKFGSFNNPLLDATIHYNHVHFSKNIEESVDPTCNEGGYKKCVCVCGYRFTEEISELGHDIVIDDAVAPTCTATGLTEGQHCSRCEDATVAQEIIPMIKHTAVTSKNDSTNHWGVCSCGEKLNLEGHKYGSDNVCDVCEYEKVITLKMSIRKPSTTTISYGDSIILHADMNEALPSGWSFKWSASNGNFDYSVSADGTTCTITPSKSGDTVFTATVYDAEGNEICKDEQTMTSKAGFFDKIIAFFKKLFGLTKVIPQAFNSIY